MTKLKGPVTQTLEALNPYRFILHLHLQMKSSVHMGKIDQYHVTNETLTGESLVWHLIILG